MEENPNGESACAATHMASDRMNHTGGMIAHVLTASPLDTRLSTV